MIGTISNSHIKNNTDLIDRLNDVSVPYEFKLVSFDVTSLFTKVPLFDLLNFLSQELDNCNIPVNKTDLITVIKLSKLDNKFKFENDFYMQKFGFSMGRPASPTLSNLYMEFYFFLNMNFLKFSHLTFLGLGMWMISFVFGTVYWAT